MEATNATVCAECACLLFIIQSKHRAERLRAKFVILIGFSTDFCMLDSAQKTRDTKEEDASQMCEES